MQLDLFEHTSLKPDQLFMHFIQLKESHEKLRRGIFKRYQELEKTVLELQMKMEGLKN